MVHIPQALQGAQGVLAMLNPFPEAERLEGYSCSRISFFWSEGCSSLGGAAGLRWGSAAALRTCLTLGELSLVPLQSETAEL